MAASNRRDLTALWVTDPDSVVLECRLALAQENGVIAHAAKRLGVGRTTLYRWIEKRPEILKET